MILNLSKSARVMDPPFSICSRSAGENIEEAQLAIEWPFEGECYHLDFVFRRVSRGVYKCWLFILAGPSMPYVHLAI